MIEIVGHRENLFERRGDYLSNTEKTLTSKNLSASLNLSGNRRPKLRPNRPRSAMAMYDVAKNEMASIEHLERTLSELKQDLRHLNDSLQDNYGKSLVYARGSDYDEKKYVSSFYNETGLGSEGEELDDKELDSLMWRNDEEAVSHLPPDDSKWYRDPEHLTTSMGNYETSKKMGISTRSVSPTNRGVGILGAEMATKNIHGQLTSTDLAQNMETFPVRLTAPHIIGVSSLRPPEFPVIMMDPERSKSPQRRPRSEEISKRHMKTPKPAGRPSSPKPLWVPNSRNANASAKAPPPLRKSRRGRSVERLRPATAQGLMHRDRSPELVTRGTGLTMARHITSGSSTIRRQIHPLPSETELRFLRSADQIDTRKALVENSPYQQELARLRLARLRVEEEYLLQLKRESELERIRGPKPKWYAMKGPQFHYECNKNTALHKNKSSWGKTLRYRNELLESSMEFSKTL